MKKFLLFIFLALFAASPVLAAEPATTPVQFPDSRFPDQRFPAQDQLLDLERQQIAQETLMILRDMVNVMRQAKDIDQGDRERLENLSSRLDFLITRQQELSMRSRLGR